MALTPAQLATLKAAINADPVLAAKPMNGDGDFEIAQILNTEIAVPDFYVWRIQVSVNEIMGNGFDWTRVDNMTAGEARIWDFMTKLGVINPNQSNIRGGVNEAFKGSVQDDTMRQAIYRNHLSKLGSRTEKIFANGAGTISSNAGVGPATVTIISITPSDVRDARNS